MIFLSKIYIELNGVIELFSGGGGGGGGGGGCAFKKVP